ncbi:putative Lipoprotein, partial [Pseudomonas syringae pv. cerasicola]
EVPGESGMKQFALLSLIGGALLAGCTADPLPIRQDHSYVMEWIGERPLIDNSRLTMTLGADGRAYGNAGCNHWFAPYTLNDHSISFGPVGKTRKMCAPRADGAGTTLHQSHQQRATLGHLAHRATAPVASPRQATALLAGR